MSSTGDESALPQAEGNTAENPPAATDPVYKEPQAPPSGEEHPPAEADGTPVDADSKPTETVAEEQSVEAETTGAEAQPEPEPQKAPSTPPPDDVDPNGPTQPPPGETQDNTQPPPSQDAPPPEAPSEPAAEAQQTTATEAEQPTRQEEQTPPAAADTQGQEPPPQETEQAAAADTAPTAADTEPAAPPRDVSPPPSPQQRPQMSREEAEKELTDMVATLDAAGTGLADETVQNLNVRCMGLERVVDASRITHILQRVASKTTDPSCLALTFNNIGCVQKRSGSYSAAVQSLLKAAEYEGGTATATPTTLLNLSATYLALEKFGEAAAVGHFAVVRCTTDLRPYPAVVKAAAYHNLATALEASGELQGAADAYDAALNEVANSSGVQSHHARTIQRCAEQLQRRREDAEAAEKRSEWVRQSGPQLRRHKAKAQRNTQTPPLPPLVDRQQRALTTSVKTQNTSVSVARAGMPPSLAAYTTPIRKSPLRLDPIEMRKPSPQLTAPAQTVDWNSDPVVHSHSAPHRPTIVQKDWMIERRVEERYISRALVPIVEDLIYKEATRRRALIREWNSLIQKLKVRMTRQALAAKEEEGRGELEVQEVRVRRLLLHWIHGKLLFAEGSLRVEGEEKRARDGIERDVERFQTDVTPTANLLRCEAVSEATHNKLLSQEAAERNGILLAQETSIVNTSVRDAFLTNKVGMSAALSVWCLESVMTKEEALGLLNDHENDRMVDSLHVLERYVLFGYPRGKGNKPHKHSSEQPPQ